MSKFEILDGTKSFVQGASIGKPSIIRSKISSAKTVFIGGNVVVG